LLNKTSKIKKMKKLMIAIAGTAFIAGAMLTGCESSTQKVDAARDNLQDAKVNVVEAKIELTQALRDSIQADRVELEQKISLYDKSIAELKLKVNTQKKESKAVYEQTLNELELKSKQLKKKLQEYKEEGLSEWDSFKNEFRHDMDELGAAISDLTKNNVK